ncbi:MAG: nitrile hydratase subunit beta [Pseudohongiellaceae bacterium]
MKGGHDLGGQKGLGPINPEPEAQEPVFHAQWERRVFALTLATGMLGKWNIDESRHARERQDPLAYLNNSYYENWLTGLETLLLEKGLVDAGELSQASPGANNQAHASLSVPSPQQAEKFLFTGSSSLMPTQEEPGFRVGDRVTVRKMEASGHTRAPGYAQGASGVVSALLGCHSYPDTNAAGVHEGKPLYTVAFRGQDLWGAYAKNSEVFIDLWEPYLIPAQS